MTIGNSMLLDSDQAGSVFHGGGCKVFGVAVTAPLVGALTITGITDDDGQPAPWWIAPGDSGAFTPPGSGQAFGNLSYSLQSEADLGKVVVAWQPR